MEAFDTIVLGAGPAGTGPLLAALQAGTAQAWLARGVLWADAGEGMGPGSLLQYGVDSDTAAKALLEGLGGDANPLRTLLAHPMAAQLQARGEGAVPLVEAGAFYTTLGAQLEAIVRAHPPSAFWPRHRAQDVVRLRDGSFRVTFAEGRQARAKRLVFAMGGYQDHEATLDAELLPGLTLRSVVGKRVSFSGEMLAVGGPAPHVERLGRLGRPVRVAVLGSSHSAFCVADLLLRHLPANSLADGSIRLVARSIPRPFYLSGAAAHDDGYHDFDARDVCPVTGRVFRLGGLRMASRNLLRAMLGLGGMAQERRCRLVRLQDTTSAGLSALLREADLVVAALGYRPHGLPMREEDGAPLRLASGAGYANPRVDDQCRLLDALGRPVPNAYGIGLASGFVPRGPQLGGEASFRGQTNGLWLYRHDLGRLLLHQLMEGGVDALIQPPALHVAHG